MTPAPIRPAGPADLPAIERLVAAAYAPYVARLGKPPGPMLDDYRGRIAGGAVWVIEQADGLAGLLVLLDAPDHLLLDNVAVAPAHHGQGLGRRLIAFAEAEAARRGQGELRLYTHVLMRESQALYARLGFVETHRAEQAGFPRVFMRKRIDRPA